MKPQSGFEPETSCLQGKRSNQLSYNGSYYFTKLIQYKILYHFYYKLIILLFYILNKTIIYFINKTFKY